MKSVFAGNGLRQSSAVENGNECCGIWIRNSRPTGQVERSEEHTSELQSHLNLVCRLLLEKKKTSLHSKTTLFTLNFAHAPVEHIFILRTTSYHVKAGNKKRLLNLVPNGGLVGLESESIY